MKKTILTSVAVLAAVFATAWSAHAFTNLTVAQAYDKLAADQAIMIDVRTVDEYAWVGHPGKNKLGEGAEIEDAVVNIAWEIEKPGKGYELILNNHFLEDVEKAIPYKDQPIITICRSGGRSVAAATALEALGYTEVYNTLKGFEGGADSKGYRTKAEGWKNTGLPYTFGYTDAYDHAPGN